MSKKYRWGTMVPLIGGSAIGCSQATETLPQFHFSFDGFEANDEGILNYWKDEKIPYYHIDSEEVPLTEKRFQNIDFVNSVCPCAALARINTSTGEMVGGNAPQNQWMYKSAEFILEKIKPTVYWGENAPALNMDAGKPVVANLMKIGKKYGYSFSIYKTSTIYHGLPQKRERCFYFFWKGDKIPVLNFFDRERPTYAEFLSNVNDNLSEYDIITGPVFSGTHKPTDYLPFRYLLEKSGKTYSEYFKDNSSEAAIKSTMGIIRENGCIDDIIKWMKENHYEEATAKTQHQRHNQLEWMEYVKEKWENNKGIFYQGPIFTYNYCPAVISKNCAMMIHPTEDRYLSLREMASLMGMPADFKLTNSHLKHGYYTPQMIGQNVPVNTVRDVASQVLRFIDGDKTLQYVTVSNGYYLQNNVSKVCKEVSEKTTKKLF